MPLELDTVVLTRDVPEHGLVQGDVGVVVHLYEGAPTYEVEFVTGEGQTVAVLTLTEGEIRAVRAREILHARELASV